MKFPSEMWLVLNSCYQIVRASKKAREVLAVPSGRCRSLRNVISRWKDEERFSLHAQEVRTVMFYSGAGERHLHSFKLAYHLRDGAVSVFDNHCTGFRLKSGLHFLLVITPAAC